MSFPNEELAALWAPWRAEYYKIGKPGADFFTEAAQTSDDRAHYVVHRAKSSYLMLNKFPYTCGHMMAVPYRKVAWMEELADGERLEIWEMALVAQKLLRHALKAEGFNVGYNLGRCAGAGVAEHLHLHIVPRWEGDRNFMPVLTGASIIPDGLDAVYDKLMEAKKQVSNE